MENKEVVYFNEAEASMIKEPKEFPDFMYDNDSNGGVLNKFDEISKKIEEIKTNIQALNTEYKNLQSIYEEFTDFNSTMDGNIQAYNESISRVSTAYATLNENMKAQVTEIAKADDTFIEDVDLLTNSLKSEEDVAKEVLAGKWGTGPDRAAALAAAGYDAAAVQSIVNQMINGTYEGGKNPTEGKTPTEPAPTPTETTTPEPTPATFPQEPTHTGAGIPQVGPDGLIVRQKSDAGQAVINKLFAEIPSHANGTHSAQLDAMIDNLSPEECAWVLSRIENEGFGQTGAGYSTATPESHANFIEQQVVGRFGGDIHNLLKHWGTYSYSGY